MKEPHILIASSNPRKMLENIRHIIGASAVTAIENEIQKNTKELFELGEEQYNFARQTAKLHWRQRISRFYYGSYNVRRAIQLSDEGLYSTSSDDHKNIYKLPKSLKNMETYKNQLPMLRQDRNLADYDHSVSESDLLFTQEECEQIVTNFINDAKIFLQEKGVHQ